MRTHASSCDCFALFRLLIAINALSKTLVVGASSYSNVYGNALQPCSSSGMALTGYTRTGYCVDRNDDQGSHHICIDMSSTSGGNFCDVTGQSDWCSQDAPCDNGSSSSSTEYCPIQNWCVCQWAFASYIRNAGGCDQIQEIVCDSINLQAVLAYQQQAAAAAGDGDDDDSSSSSSVQSALECLVDRCGLNSSVLSVRAALPNRFALGNNLTLWLSLVGAAGLFVAAAVVMVASRYSQRQRRTSPFSSTSWNNVLSGKEKLLVVEDADRNKDVL